MNPRLSALPSLACWLLLSFAAAALGGLASASAGSFYRELAQPVWAPPGWLFGPAWTVLYILMGVAAWMIWRERHRPGAKAAITIYLAQLALNALWTWLFFAWRLGAAAFAEIVLLWVLILATMLAFRRIRPAAAWLLAPYLAWVTFAAALCFTIWRMNPDLL